MAIQQINLGSAPSGAGGDTQRAANEKINQNFSNQTHAASRLVGTAKGNVMEVGAYGLGYSSYTSISSSTYFDDKYVTNKSGFSAYFDPNGYIFPDRGQVNTIMIAYSEDWATQMAFRPSSANAAPKYRSFHTGTTWSEWASFYTTTNTKLDTNGAISPSSPTIDLYNDRIEANADGAKMNPEFVRNGVGDYTIKNTTGLRDEGWHIKIPNDMNGNPKVAVAIDTDEGGNLNIKTYKRTFSMETFTFGPDLSEPLDIPEGRWIDLRFNDLPEEQPDEPIE